MALLPLLLVSLLPLLQAAALLVMGLAAPVVGRWGAELGKGFGVGFELQGGCAKRLDWWLLAEGRKEMA
jgi:hypothetical protein